MNFETDSVGGAQIVDSRVFEPEDPAELAALLNDALTSNAHIPWTENSMEEITCRAFAKLATRNDHLP